MFSELVVLLESLGWSVYDTDVPEQPRYPYIVVWGGDARPHVESPLASKVLGVQDRVGVTYAAGTPQGARMVCVAAREVLQPQGFPVTVAGYTLKLADHQPAQVDRDVKMTATDRHPAYAVDIFEATR